MGRNSPSPEDRVREIDAACAVHDRIFDAVFNLPITRELFTAGDRVRGNMGARSAATNWRLHPSRETPRRWPPCTKFWNS